VLRSAPDASASTDWTVCSAPARVRAPGAAGDSLLEQLEGGVQVHVLLLQATHDLLQGAHFLRERW
jgi:hypothetical protein